MKREPRIGAGAAQPFPAQRVPPPGIRVTKGGAASRGGKAQVAAEVATSGAARHSLGWPPPLLLHVQTQGNPWSEY